MYTKADVDRDVSQLWATTRDIKTIDLSNVRCILFTYPLEKLRSISLLLIMKMITPHICEPHSTDQEGYILVKDYDKAVALLKLWREDSQSLAEFKACSQWTIFMAYPDNIIPRYLERGVVNELYSDAMNYVNLDQESSDYALIASDANLRRFLRLLFQHNVFHCGMRSGIQSCCLEENSIYRTVWYEVCPQVNEMTMTLRMDGWMEKLRYAKCHLMNEHIFNENNGMTETLQLVLSYTSSIRHEFESLQVNQRDWYFSFYLNLMMLLVDRFHQQPTRSNVVQRLSSRKEAIAGAGIYTPMFQFCTILQSRNVNLFPIVELNLSSLAAIFARDAFADISSTLILDQNVLMPQFIVEYATESIDDKKRTDGSVNERTDRSDSFYHCEIMRHKDMEKLSVSMVAALLNVLDEIGESAWTEENYPNISIYGALVYNWTVQFLEIRPIHCDRQREQSRNAIELVLFSPPEWCITLHDGNPIQLTNMEQFLTGIVKVWHIMDNIHAHLRNLSAAISRFRQQNPNAAATTKKERYQFAPGVAPYVPTSRPSTNTQTPSKKRQRLDANMDAVSAKEENVTTVANRILEDEKFSCSKTSQEDHDRIIWQLKREDLDYFGILKFGHHAVNECKLLNQLESPFVVQVLFSATGPDDTWQLMVQPQLYYDYDRLLSENNVSDYGDRVQNILLLMDNVLQGVVALHDKFILHRDIKPDNILYDRLNARWVIVDLDCAVQLSNAIELLQEDDDANLPGTDGFRAPEIEKRQCYGLQADIYSLSRCMVRIMLRTEATFLVANERLMPKSAREAAQALEDLLLVMKSENPVDRPTAKEALDQLTRVRKLLQEEDVQQSLAKSRHFSILAS